MAKKKWHYYVLVFTEEGPKYVTSIHTHHMAHFDATEKPLDMSAEWAEDIYKGLCLNFFNATLVKSLFEIESQPYNYKENQLTWKKRKAGSTKKGDK